VLDPACGTGGFLLAAANYTDPANLHGIELDRAVYKVRSEVAFLERIYYTLCSRASLAR
jgi:type I restriction-modification system DNA methylase subunit